MIASNSADICVAKPQEGYGWLVQNGRIGRRTGVPPVLADGLPACRFIGGQAGRAVFPNRLEACFPIKGRKTFGIGRYASVSCFSDRLIQPFRHALLAAALLATPLHADVYTLSAPHYACNAGALVTVPVSLDNAAGIAGIRVQVNYDPQVLALTDVQAGPLGAQFDLSHEIADGAVTLDFVRATPLATGAGQLALLHFVTNAGATTDLYSDLALAKFEISDETGVRDLAATHTPATSNGSVSVSVARDIDNAGNGLPDWWELQYGLDLFAPANQDSDGDSCDNLLEFAFGGNPRVPDVDQTNPGSSILDVEAHPYLTVTFRRRKERATLNYLLQECDTLGAWSSVSPDLRLVAPPLDLGNGMERVTVRGAYPLDAPEAPAQSFLRIGVENR